MTYRPAKITIPNAKPNFQLKQSSGRSSTDYCSPQGHWVRNIGPPAVASAYAS